jgi:hypothetical protein
MNELSKIIIIILKKKHVILIKIANFYAYLDNNHFNTQIKLFCIKITKIKTNN